MGRKDCRLCTPSEDCTRGIGYISRDLINGKALSRFVDEMAKLWGAIVVITWVSEIAATMFVFTPVHEQRDSYGFFILEQGGR
jgi:hypothetical protein